MKTAFAKARQECLIGIKAYQDFTVALDFATLAKTVLYSNKPIALAAYFHALVINYSKPFSDSFFNGGKARYKLSTLKSANGFDINIHNTIIAIRNKLIAHNDLDNLEARILTLCMEVDDFEIPMQITLSGKSLMYASKINFYDDFINHVTNAIASVRQKINIDITILRKEQLKNPQDARQMERFKEHLGSEQIPIDGKRISPPKDCNLDYLKIPTPEYADELDGFTYGGCTIRAEFHGPEEIDLPNGSKIILQP